MKTRIDFYIDFISPFGYLAAHELPRIASELDCELVYHVVTLQELKLRAGNTGPSNRDIPIKRKYIQEDRNRWARVYGIPIQTPASYDAERLNRGAFLAQDRNLMQAYAAKAGALTWGSGGPMGTDATIIALADGIGIPSAELLAYCDSDDAIRRLAESTDAAHKRGVFGVPTMMVGDEMWWGNDRLDFMKRRIEQLHR